jgi:hypothetical protein
VAHARPTAGQVEDVVDGYLHGDEVSPAACARELGRVLIELRDRTLRGGAPCTCTACGASGCSSGLARPSGSSRGAAARRQRARGATRASGNALYALRGRRRAGIRNLNAGDPADPGAGDALPTVSGPSDGGDRRPPLASFLHASSGGSRCRRGRPRDASPTAPSIGGWRRLVLRHRVP